MIDKSVQDILLYEVRETRKELGECRKEINDLKLSVFSNKVKLGFFISGITIILNILFIFIKEKAKAFLS